MSSLLPLQRVSAFDRQRLVARGPLVLVKEDVERYLARDPDARIQLIDDLSGNLLGWPVEGDLPMLSEAAVTGGGDGVGADAPNLAGEGAARQLGRPKLGVVAREVTLLPGQWAWLATQPGGASAALRRLVDNAWRDEQRAALRRHAQEVVYRCLTAIGDGLLLVDEALLAIYLGDVARFDQVTLTWPADVRDYLRELGFPEPPMSGL